MSNVNVGLDIRNFACQPNDGYTNTTTSNQTVYSYKFSGGTDGHGGVEESSGAGTGSITVQIGTDPRYTVSDVTLTGDIENQLSWAHGQTNTIAVITDTDTSSGSGYYSVICLDGTANCTFPCDPPITNKPSK